MWIAFISIDNADLDASIALLNTNSAAAPLINQVQSRNHKAHTIIRRDPRDGAGSESANQNWCSTEDLGPGTLNRGQPPQLQNFRR